MVAERRDPWTDVQSAIDYIEAMMAESLHERETDTFREHLVRHVPRRDMVDVEVGDYL